MTVKPYQQLREEIRDRDKSLRDKVMSLEEAVALVQDGELVGVGGSTLSRTPMAMIWALIRARKQHLSVCRSIVSSEGDLLFASGICDRIITSWFSQGIVWGVSKVMRHHVEAGAKIYEEWSHMAMGMRFRAGAMGLPFLPMRSMLGSDLLGRRPEVKQMDCPFTGEPLLLIPAINPDVAIIHVQRCDAYGNAQIDGLQFMDIDLAMAARRVIMTTEAVVSNDQIRRRPDHTKIPFFTVDAVVEVPYGAAPHECGGLYEPCFGHMDMYTSQVNSNPEAGMRAYLDEFFTSPKSWNEYLNRIGLDHLLAAGKGGRSVFND
jgi:glutaconate CoA-transferase, subunit A